ncbi:hypothetical protein B0S90_2867 [Caldicellulosiruptor bescii]|uniref:Uncharacterized protein n=2 Tax=Caldicellulosiruptor bescii TaxID=31899 RepID=B9MP33_CALBD|nr:hypothetical protein [Caldicellulosiruptor bescii]ACM61592.1 hypothetical protein Athe_2524 [Caldicellulosiruptor bescii DSM 6725]PBC88599.1 hypothetical protein B0S87_1624 [Caldicellulosiruptor bescii]PBC91920.1 hypothetical protein B0S89_2369 [Caldicellulosiruptor bescii]PBD02669.1 hypothetical protein B0S85_0205 [Caldicellulosiruptor bescii]PBD07715.1 hypothetical protein B0S90_2867 [Caldicellulosiruptor bescii]
MNDMVDILDRARIALLYPKNDSKRERIEYEVSDNMRCSVCGEKAYYRLSKTPAWFCTRHYNQLLNRSLWDFIDRYLVAVDPLAVLYLEYKDKNINLEIWFTEKIMKDIQYYFRDAGFRNLRLDKETFLSVVRSCNGVAYADWIDNKLITFMVPVHDCLITKQEWEEIKQKVIKKGLLKKVQINNKSPDYDF